MYVYIRIKKKKIYVPATCSIEYRLYMFGLRLRGRYRYKRSYKPGYIKFKKKKGLSKASVKVYIPGFEYFLMVLLVLMDFLTFIFGLSTL